MEFFLEIILEPILYAYFDFFEGLIGCNRLKKWQENLLIIASSVVFAISAILVIIGIFWAIDAEPFKTYGKVLLIVGVCVLLIHISFALLFGIKRFSKRKREEELLDYEGFIRSNPSPHISCVQTNDSETET